MRPLPISAITVTSALGIGLGPTLEALLERRGALRPCDFDGIERGGHIGRIDAVEEHRLPPSLVRFDCRNNRLASLALAADGFAAAAAAAAERYGADRVAVVLGTSTSGIQASELAFRARDSVTAALPAAFDYEHTQDLFSLARFVRAALGLRGPAISISTACASSARTFMDAHHLIEAGVCDAAVVGGADSLCRMTLHGFSALELISPVPCRPCDTARSGISIGEAAGFALLEKDGTGPFSLLGYGASSDGHHMSAPHPDGAGAIAAMRAALACAGLPAGSVDHVNLHGTGTRANDAMEDLAVVAVFGAEAACSSTKGWTGHPLGASGIVQAAIAYLSMRYGFLPGCLGVEAVDPTFTSRVLVANEHRPVRRVVANSFGFGGINCSLVLGQAA